MSYDMTIEVTRDTANPMLARLSSFATEPDTLAQMAEGCVRLTRNHLEGLGPNKQGWPSTRFYHGAAQGTSWAPAEGGFMVSVDNPKAPGAMRQRYYGGEIRRKEHMLTIPARAEFYGHSPTEFTNLRFVAFAGGAMAFVIGKGGAGRVDFSTGKERGVRGAGARAQAMVAYWLRDSVFQEGDTGVMPPMAQYQETVELVLMQRFAQHVKGGGQ